MAVPPVVAALPSSGVNLCAMVAYNANFRGAGLLTAVEVGMAESSCVPSATGDNGTSLDRGLWQINNYYHSEVSDACAYNAQCNADAAYRISSGGTSWSQWSTYNNGAYLNYASVAQTAINGLNISAHPDAIVDDLSSGFGKYGPSQYWHAWSGGYAGHIWWTYTNVSTTENYAYWTANLPVTGRWRVFVYVPNYYGSTTNARYQVYYSGGWSAAVPINQNNYYNAWVPLKDWSFNSGTSYAYLGDATGVSSQQIAFDAIKWGWFYT
jgi:hypothetical protein